jgi:20S proteasome alpha/beta subunit
LCPAADANILLNTCRLIAQRYFFAYQEPMPVEQLVRSVCDTKQVGARVHTRLLGGVLHLCWEMVAVKQLVH